MLLLELKYSGETRKTVLFHGAHGIGVFSTEQASDFYFTQLGVVR